MRGPATARWQPQENGEATGRQNRSAASVSFPSSQRSLFEHHLFGKWDPTLPDHARADLPKMVSSPKAVRQSEVGALAKRENFYRPIFAKRNVWRRGQCDLGC